MTEGKKVLDAVGGAIPTIANIAFLFYVCRRFLAATRLRRKIMSETKEFSSTVRRARDNVRYIGEQVARGMNEIEEDVGEELRVTDRLTTRSSKLAAMLGRFAALEEIVIELLRMDRNRESVSIETPVDVNEEVRRIVAAVESKRGQRRAEPAEGVDPASADVSRWSSTPDSARRNPLSKFSTRVPRGPVDDRPRTPTTPEVRLLGEPSRPVVGR